MAEPLRWFNDSAEHPPWIKALAEVRLLGEPPLRVGSRVLRVAHFLGRRIEYINEVVELEPGTRLAMRSVKAPFPMSVVYEFEEAGEATLMRIRAQGDADGFYRLAASVLSRAVKRTIAADLRRLKNVLEQV